MSDTPGPVYDSAGNFHGHWPRECGYHRTVGAHRAWCDDCKEWCYPLKGCTSCRRTEGPN